VPRPRGWASIVNEAMEERSLAVVRDAVCRGRPYGKPEWVERVAGRLGLAFTLRPRGRPRKIKREG
jgi:hypothetical protein